jgi:hypothetical protein
VKLLWMHPVVMELCQVGGSGCKVTSAATAECSGERMHVAGAKTKKVKKFVSQSALT